MSDAAMGRAFAVSTARQSVDKALDALSEHRLLGRPVRFCRRRREQVLYLVVGGWNTLFGYAEWALMEYLLHDYLHYIAILVLSWPLAVLNAYVCYRHFVFRSKHSVWKDYHPMSLGGLAFSSHLLAADRLKLSVRVQVPAWRRSEFRDAPQLLLLGRGDQVAVDCGLG